MVSAASSIHNKVPSNQPFGLPTVGHLMLLICIDVFSMEDHAIP